VGISGDSRNFSSTPYYLRNGKSYELQIWQVYSQRPCEQKTLKNLGKKGALAYPGTSQIFKVFPIISGTRKATNLKFGKYIQRVHANKRPLNLEVKGVWAYQGLPKCVSSHIE